MTGYYLNSDMCRCQGQGCDIRETCLRHMAFKHPHSTDGEQWVSCAFTMRRKDEAECGSFMPLPDEREGGRKS